MLSNSVALVIQQQEHETKYLTKRSKKLSVKLKASEGPLGPKKLMT